MGIEIGNLIDLNGLTICCVVNNTASNENPTKPEEIVCTPEHPFYILNTTPDTRLINFEGRNNNEHNGQWVASKDLKPGMHVLLASGNYGTISSLEVEELETPETTYNFEVEDYHTYYVGAEGVLVHNDCPYAYLEEALQRQGLDKIPEGGFKETWIRDGYKFEVRAHAGDPQFTNAQQIFRVSRQAVPIPGAQGTGIQYLATNGVWYHQSTLVPVFRTEIINTAYNEWAAIHTHIPVR